MPVGRGLGCCRALGLEINRRPSVKYRGPFKGHFEVNVRRADGGYMGKFIKGSQPKRLHV